MNHPGFNAMQPSRGVTSTRALLHDLCGAFVTERQVVGPPEVIEHDGRRFELAESENGYARYFEARVGD